MKANTLNFRVLLKPKKKNQRKEKACRKGLVGLVSDNFGRFGLIPAVADRQSEQISSVTVLSGTG